MAEGRDADSPRNISTCISIFKTDCLTADVPSKMEPNIGIEPMLPPYQSEVLPLN